MRNRTLAIGLCLLSAAAAPAADGPYDGMARTFRPYLDPADAVAWPAKVRAIARDEYHFWRGTRDLFYAWCGDHCRDWLNDPNAAVVSQGDLHLGNLGAYAARPFGTVAFGLVDFDESARLPFQIELLQGVVTFELLARQNKLDLSASERTALRSALFEAYRGALARPKSGTDALKQLLPDRTGRPYADDLSRFTAGDRFRAGVAKKNGTVTDLLRPVPADRRAGLADALAAAVNHDPRLAALLRPHTAADFADSILDAADRTRIDSSGSQGLSKVLVLLRQPFRDRPGDGLLYLKQQIPSAAERAGVVPKDPRPPGERYVRDLDALTHGQSLAASWCDWDGRSYWVSVKEPWGVEIDDAGLDTVAKLIAAARAFSATVADSHAEDAARLAALLTPAVRDDVDRRADAYLTEQAKAFADFTADPRARAAVRQFSASAATQRTEP